MDKRKLGGDKEDIAEFFLNQNGVKVLFRNYYTKHGEIDIIGMDQEYLVFFEVKYRRNNLYGNPLEAVGKNKIKNIIKASRIFLYLEHYPENTLIRFDCIGILNNQVEWVKNAFP